MSARGDDHPARDAGLERLVTFSDGVFAIAITLLILDIQVPDVPKANGAPDLSRAVWDLGPTLFSYALSFLVIGLYWQVHRRVFSHIVRNDTMLTWLNLVYLMFVAFLPFPTAMLGDYPDARFALVFYAGVQVVIGTLSTTMWLYASRGHRLIAREMPESAIRTSTINGLIPPLVFLCSIGVAFVSLDLAPYVWIALAFNQPIRAAIAKLLHRG